MFNKKFWLIFVIILTILNILLITLSQPLTELGKELFNRLPTYYAVHLSNGQVYFGQIKEINSETIVLKDVFFLEILTSANQTFGEIEEQALPQQTYQLIRRGSDNLALTDNVLFINRSMVLFWEKLSPESEVVEWIQRAESGR